MKVAKMTVLYGIMYAFEIGFTNVTLRLCIVVNTRNTYIELNFDNIIFYTYQTLDVEVHHLRPVDENNE